MQKVTIQSRWQQLLRCQVTVKLRDYAKAVLRVVFVGKVSEGDERDRVAVAHQHKVGHLVPYLEIQ